MFFPIKGKHMMSACPPDVCVRFEVVQEDETEPEYNSTKKPAPPTPSINPRA